MVQHVEQRLVTVFAPHVEHEVTSFFLVISKRRHYVLKMWRRYRRTQAADKISNRALPFFRNLIAEYQKYFLIIVWNCPYLVLPRIRSAPEIGAVP